VTTLVGRSLGRYKLEKLLGQGGMAQVYRATDTKLARSVAVKVILATHANEPQFLERFLREARVVASLEHPNILPVYDFGEEEGIPFLVMPCLEGGTLRDRMTGLPIEFSQAASWIRQLALALDAAHEAGVLHRDVKPANVLIGRGDRLALADFGIAKMLETMTGLTATGVVVGTPLYMAPEQAQGKPASPATDRYSLAVIAYELLAGAPPFEGENPLALMHQHVTTPAPFLSTKVRGLPVGLDGVFARALSKDPAERPPTCRALADAVSAFLPTGALSVADPAPQGPTRRTAPMSPPAGSVPVAVATPPPSLTSDQTVLTGPPRRTRRLAFGAVAAAAVVLGAVGVVMMRRASAPAPVPTPAPTAVPTAPRPETKGNESKLLLDEQKKIAEDEKRLAGLEARVKEAEAAAAAAKAAAASAGTVPTPARPALPPPAAEKTIQEPEGADGALTAAFRRLEPVRKRDHRLSREDFEFAASEARQVLKDRPNRPDAKYLETYARGGLDYLAGRDAAAGQAIIDALEDLKKQGRREARQLGLLVLKGDGGIGPPSGWQLALAYGDARGEAEKLLEKEMASSPTPRTYAGRATLRRIQGRDELAIADAKKALELHPRPAIASAIAEFLGEEYARSGSFEEAVAWYRQALKTPGPATGIVALRAGRLSRDRLGREADALEFFRIACRAGNMEGCKESGQTSDAAGAGRFKRRLAK
jgi:tetratricopeptide (TPR) repeat protein/tRNA A-37 threonylcarbamoyl transferase component Bud32